MILPWISLFIKEKKYVFVDLFVLLLCLSLINIFVHGKISSNIEFIPFMIYSNSSHIYIYSHSHILLIFAYWFGRCRAGDYYKPLLRKGLFWAIPSYKNHSI